MKKQNTFMGFPRKIDFEKIKIKEAERVKKEAKALADKLLGKRILTKDYSNIKELVILEYSPSGIYCKVMDSNGKKDWVEFKSINAIEVIGVYKKKVKK